LACRLAGVPIARRARPADGRGVGGDAEDERRSAAINGAVSGVKTDRPRVDLNGTQTPAPAKPDRQPAHARPVPAPDKTADAKSSIAAKQARVEDAPEGEQTGPQTLISPTAKKRVAFVDPAVLREHDDGRTKRPKTDTYPPGPAVKPSSVPQESTCSSCLDMHPKHDMLQLPCKDEGDHENHAYCRDCLQRLFESSVTDPSHFPPRCCNKIIPLFSCTPFLSQALVVRFVERREELGTPNRTYCSNPKCSKWVRPANIKANVANCTECLQKTCATCKSKEHTGLCPEDKDVKELLSVARQKRWQTCPSCKEMVELEKGCYHITYVLPINPSNPSRLHSHRMEI
jgi:hypothetical protein